MKQIAEAAQPEQILLFGSHERGEAHDDSDLDLLVYSRSDVDRWGHQPGSALFWGLREGKVMYD
ncbi:MAG: nucleotidyltransferase family protein [Halochromatium sp.]|uniref:nucleotidyltransferase family protein n=1 Tax=Halochromatium sp. TaxID=2049430 RepID=UPI0039785718